MSNMWNNNQIYISIYIYTSISSISASHISFLFQLLLWRAYRHDEYLSSLSGALSNTGTHNFVEMTR